jgi:hypothetical protein
MSHSTLARHLAFVVANAKTINVLAMRKASFTIDGVRRIRGDQHDTASQQLLNS